MTNPVSLPTLLTPLHLPAALNLRVQYDLYGPLKMSDNGKKVILAVTDACIKYVELVALPTKEASGVTDAIFKHWICRYSCPVTIHMDQGKEFVNQLSA
jgi:IS30 family transposase